jgi:hypothetical protein
MGLTTMVLFANTAFTSSISPYHAWWGSASQEKVDYCLAWDTFNEELIQNTLDRTIAAGSRSCRQAYQGVFTGFSGMSYISLVHLNGGLF